MKALILTRSPVSNAETCIINKASCFKLSVNHTDYKSDYRIFRDCCKYKKYVDKYNEPFITERGNEIVIEQNGHTSLFDMIYNPTSNPTLIQDNDIFIYSGSISPAMHFTIKQGYTEIMLVAMNTAYYKRFQDDIKKACNILLDKFEIKMYKYSQDANLDIPYKSLMEFCFEGNSNNKKL